MKLNRVYSEVSNWFLIFTFVHPGFAFAVELINDKSVTRRGFIIPCLSWVHFIHCLCIQEQHGLIMNAGISSRRYRSESYSQPPDCFYRAGSDGISPVALLITRQSGMQIFGRSSHPSMYAVEICLSEYRRERRKLL